MRKRKHRSQGPSDTPPPGAGPTAAHRDEVHRADVILGLDAGGQVHRLLYGKPRLGELVRAGHTAMLYVVYLDTSTPAALRRALDLVLRIKGRVDWP